MCSLCSCTVIVHYLILEDRSEFQLRKLVFSCGQFLKKKFQGHVEKGAASFNRQLVVLYLKFLRCSAFSCILPALSESMQHFTSPTMSVVIAGIEHQKTQSLPDFLIFFCNEFLLHV